MWSISKFKRRRKYLLWTQRFYSDGHGFKSAGEDAISLQKCDAGVAFSAFQKHRFAEKW